MAWFTLGGGPMSSEKSFSSLLALRDRCDYGLMEPVSRQEAQGAIKAAEEILRAVSAERPGDFGGLEKG